jgi:rubrerythrin
MIDVFDIVKHDLIYRMLVKEVLPILMKTPRFPLFIVFCGCITILFLVSPLVSAQSRYPETTAVLKMSYAGEFQALHSYAAYAQKANSENYPNIARLFAALAASEIVHARNFTKLLSELRTEAEKMPTPKIDVSSTRNNLKNAIDIELEEVDTRYPQFIQRIKPENFEAAIQEITYAWKSEQQHKELLQKIRSATGMFFGLLTKKIEGNPVDYFVCQRCGSTLVELPKDSCPVCDSPVSVYKKI